MERCVVDGCKKWAWEGKNLCRIHFQCGQILRKESHEFSEPPRAEKVHQDPKKPAKNLPSFSHQSLAKNKFVEAALMACLDLEGGSLENSLGKKAHTICNN